MEILAWLGLFNAAMNSLLDDLVVKLSGEFMAHPAVMRLWPDFILVHPGFGLIQSTSFALLATSCLDARGECLNDFPKSVC